MKRRGAALTITLALGLVIAQLAVEAQPTRNIHTIGFFGPPPSAGVLVQAFQRGLRDLGYVEGQNVRIEYRYTDVALQGHPELFPRLAAELVRLKPDVLVLSVTEAALAAKNATSTIPIVMVSVADPAAAALLRGRRTDVPGGRGDCTAGRARRHRQRYRPPGPHHRL